MSKVDHAVAFHHREILAGIHVRPIYTGERDLWDALIRQHHYLGLHSLVGKTLRYVAVFQGHWLALLGWQAAALKCKDGDRWIGWAPVTQYQRLHFIANNSRFLILPGVRIKNLASRILSLNLKRLSSDWLGVHGHPVFLAETFVETPRFTGACYRADKRFLQMRQAVHAKCASQTDPCLPLAHLGKKNACRSQSPSELEVAHAIMYVEFQTDGRSLHSPSQTTGQQKTQRAQASLHLCPHDQHSRPAGRG